MQVSRDTHIDPKDPQSAMLMEALINFSLKNGEVFLKANSPYKINLLGSEGPITLYLTNDVLLRVKDKIGKDGLNHLEPHCYVLGPITNRGGLQNAGVPDILGTLTLDKNDKNGLIYIPDELKNKSRLVKIRKHKLSSQFLDKNEFKYLEESKKLIESRLSILQAYAPFHAKNIISKKINQFGEIESYTKIRKFKGQLLSEILSEDKLTTQNRIDLSIALLQELKVLHNLGVAHCDIKPENIIVRFDNETGKVAVRFIDLDTAKTKTIEGESGFTHPYASPEQILDSRHKEEGNKGKKTVDTKSDIWQMGLVLAEVWRGKQRDKNWHINLDDKDLLTHKAEPHLIDELDMFRDIKAINIDAVKFNNHLSKLLYEISNFPTEFVDFDLIANTITNLLRAEKDNRMEIDQATDNFENIRFKYLYPSSLNPLEENEILMLENEKNSLLVRINKLKVHMSNDNLTEEKKAELNEILLSNEDKIDQINRRIKLNSFNSLISALMSVNFYAKQLRNGDLFHISLSPKEIANLEIRGFDPTLNYIKIIMKDENEKNKMILVNEVKDVLHLNSFNACEKLEDIHATSKAMLNDLLNLKYQHLNLVFKIKMILQFLTDPAKNLKITSEKKSDFLNPLITMNALLTKIHELYQGRTYHLNHLDDIQEFNIEFERKLNALEHCFDDVNNRCKHLLKAKGAKGESSIILVTDTDSVYFERYEAVLKKLNINVPEKVLDELKNCIKVGILEYLDEVNKEKLIPPNRLEDIEKLCNILNDNSITEADGLMKNVQNYLDKMKRRFISASPLQTHIETAMKDFRQRPGEAQDIPFNTQVFSSHKTK